MVINCTAVFWTAQYYNFCAASKGNGAHLLKSTAKRRRTGSDLMKDVLEEEVKAATGAELNGTIERMAARIE